MKLFSTITSERGKPVTKSGNEYIDVLVNNEKRENLCRLEIEDMQESTYISLLNFTTGEKHIIHIPKPKTAREEKKESWCDFCKMDIEYTENPLGEQFCLVCGSELN